MFQKDAAAAHGVAALPAGSIHRHTLFHCAVPVSHPRGGDSAHPGHEMSQKSSKRIKIWSQGLKEGSEI